MTVLGGDCHLNLLVHIEFQKTQVSDLDVPIQSESDGMHNIHARRRRRLMGPGDLDGQRPALGGHRDQARERNDRAMPHQKLPSLAAPPAVAQWNERPRDLPAAPGGP